MYDPPAPIALGLAAVLGRLALGRDETAWHALLDQIGPDLQRMARRLTGNAALADDVVQEALLQIRDHAGRFSPRTGEPDADARRWLLRLTANTALHLVRGSRRSADRHRRAAQDAPVMSSTAPDAALMHDETATLVRKALAALAEPARSAVVLHHCAGLGYEQIAAELGVPIGTAKTHVHRGLERLRQHLVRLGCTLSLTALVSVLDGLSASDGGITTLASHSALIHSSHHASMLALPNSGGLSMTTIVASVIAASLATALTIGLVRGEDALGGVLAPAATFTVMDQLVDFEFQNTPFEQALAKLGDACGIVVIIKPGVENRYPLTLKVSQMKLSEAIIWIASFSDTIIVYENGALVVKPNAP